MAKEDFEPITNSQRLVEEELDEMTDYYSDCEPDEDFYDRRED